MKGVATPTSFAFGGGQVFFSDGTPPNAAPVGGVPASAVYNPTPPVKPVAKKAAGCLGVLVGLVALTPLVLIVVIMALH